MPQTPEQAARQRIDEMLRQAGWVVQDHADLDLAAADGVAVREFPLKVGHGTADYLLYVRRRAVGVVEAKKVGQHLTGVEVQTERYSRGLPDLLPAVTKPLPYLYQSTGVETHFTNAMDPEPASRDIFWFHTPRAIAEDLRLGAPGSLYAADASSEYDRQSVLGRLQSMPPLDPAGMRACQAQAIRSLEGSLALGRRRSLIQMQTGSGKTFMAVAQAYRLIKFGGARRVLFLVDRSNLARQTLKEFQQYVTPDDGRKFTELYNVQHLQSNSIDPVCRVVITTIQRLYSILQGEPELDPELEEEGAGGIAALRKEPLPVVYNPKVPVETFDFVFTDECHRSIYNLWRQVLEYFDASLVGLTATPGKQTFAFFKQNLVMEYGHAQAVADGVNVDFDVYRIRTRITEEGGTVESGLQVDKRDRKSRKVRWEQLEEDLSYRPNELDRAVVAPDQIRTIVRTFRDRLFTEIFPGRTMVPKTLVFAKDDSHAEDIVRIMREEFGKGNAFCEKITYKSSTARIVDPVTGDVTYKSTGIKTDDLLSSFRNGVNPRIAVTVDMIATGTDVKPLEIVFFMRDVASSSYFEQMKGRGCRVVSGTEFQSVTSDAANKTRYVIVDAVGVTEHNLSDSPPLERQPTVPLKSILQAVGAGSTDAEVLSTLAGRIARLDKVLSPGQRSTLEQVAGRTVTQLVQGLVQSADPDLIAERATQQAPPEAAPVTPGEEPVAPDPAVVARVAAEMRHEAAQPFLNPELRKLLLNLQQDSEQTIATTEQDEVLFAGAGEEATKKARSIVGSFRAYLDEHRDEITAIELLYTKRHGRGPTLKQLKELAQTIGLPPRAWTPDLLWRAYELLQKDRVRGSGGRVVTDLVSLIRFALEQETLLRPFGETVQDRFAAWLAQQRALGRSFTEEQRRWLEMIRDHVASSLTIEADDFDYAPFSQQGGLGRALQVFGERFEPVLAELNEVLAA